MELRQQFVPVTNISNVTPYYVMTMNAPPIREPFNMTVIEQVNKQGRPHQFMKSGTRTTRKRISKKAQKDA